MVVQGAAPKEGWGTGADMSDQLTPRQMFCAPLLSACLFGGGNAGISDIYVHIRDIVPLSARDWESNPLERRLARWHTSLARAINDFVKQGGATEDGPRRQGITDKGFGGASGAAWWRATVCSSTAPCCASGSTSSRRNSRRCTTSSRGPARRRPPW